jgi:hypothetical protein
VAVADVHRRAREFADGGVGVAVARRLLSCRGGLLVSLYDASADTSPGSDGQVVASTSHASNISGWRLINVSAVGEPDKTAQGDPGVRNSQ